RTIEASYNIEDFVLNTNKIDISAAVPKLKGQSNFRDWETALYLALTANNRYYTHIISRGIPVPEAPVYQDNSSEVVREILIEEAKELAGDKTTTVTISAADVRARVKEIVESNIALRKEYNSKCTNWELYNSRASIILRSTLSPEPFTHISQLTDIRETFKKLRSIYAALSHQYSFARYIKWTDLRFKSGTATEFFKKAINENSKYHAFLQNLRVDKKDANLMDQVYAEFLEVDIHNRTVNPSYNTSANSTISHSVSLYNKKKDSKKNNKQSNNSNQSNSKDKSSKKKTDFQQQQQPRQGANAVFAPVSFTSTPQQGPPSGDPLARYNSLFTNTLFQANTAAIRDCHSLSQQGQLANNNNNTTRWMIDSGTSIDITSGNSQQYTLQDRHVPIDFLRPHLENPFGIRPNSPPAPTVKDDHNNTNTRHIDPLDSNNPALFEENLVWSRTDHLPNPDSFEIQNDDVEIEGILGNDVEAQREDSGAHFDIGGRGAPVEPQPASR
ncbi:hypothetical protein PENVUL_c145G04217, partial [Penicillium vulpinum]